MRAILLSLLIYIVCAAAQAGDAAEANAPVSVRFDIENAAGETAREFVRGSTVRFVFRVHNAGDAPVSLAFTFPPHRVAIVAAGGGEPVWQAFAGRMFPQVMRAQTLAPGKSVEFSAEWDFAGAPPGDYTVQPAFIGFLQPDNRPLRTDLAPQTLTLHGNPQ